LLELPGRKFIGWFFAFTLALVAVGSPAQGETTNKRSLNRIDSAPDIWLLSLPNYPNVEMTIFIASGESAATGPDGLAHFLEHLVQRNLNESIAKFDQHIQGNAFTSSTRTLYTAAINTPAPEVQNLAEFLKLRFAPFNEVVSTKDAVDSEKQAINREYDQSVRGNPDRQTGEFIRSVLFKGDGRSRKVLGTPSSIEKLSVEAAKQFHEREYVFENARILIIGDFTQEDVRSALNAGEPPSGDQEISEDSDSSAVPPTAFKACQTVVVKSVPLTRPPEIRLRRRVAASDYDSPGKAAAIATILSGVLSQPRAGSLWQSIYEESFLAEQFSLGVHQNQEEFLFSFFASPLETKDIGTLYEAIMTGLHKISENGISDAEFEAAKAVSLQSLETGRKLDGTWIAVARNTLDSLGHAITPDDWRTMIDNVSKDEIEHLLRAIVDKQTTRTVVHFQIPENKMELKPDLEQIGRTEEMTPC